RVEYETGHALGQSGWKPRLHHAAVARSGEIVAGFPAGRIEFGAHVAEALLEGLEMRVAVAVIVEADLVEIPQAAIDREVAAPIGGIAAERDAAARLHVTRDV